MSIGELVERIWAAGEQPCGKRLAPMLSLWLPHYQRRYGKLLPGQRKLTGQVSAATLDRLLAPVRFKHLRGLSGTKPGSLLRQQIPIQGEVWDEKRAGFLEADSVAHCGSSLAGSFVWSLTYTDIASTWTSGRAVWNKGATGVLEQTRQVEENLPFALLGMDFDNGSEWLNWHLIRYLQERSAPIRMTRSWPYNKKTAFVLRAGSAADSPFPWGEGKPALHKLGEGGGEGELSSGSEAIKRYSCWCPKVLAKIGHFPDTLADRCIIIRMQRKSSREQCDRFRNFDPVGLKEQCARFVEEHS